TSSASLQSQVRAEESRRQEDFSYLRYDPERGPRELGQGLESAAQHWLRPERRTAAEVVRWLFLKRIEFSKVCQSSTFNIDARHLEDIYSEERRLDGEDDLVEEDNFSEHEDWIKEEIKYNNQAEVEDEIRSASEMGQSTDVDRNTENVERSQFRNIANQMPVFGRAKRGVSAPVISSSSPNTAEKEGGTPCCLNKHSCSAFPKFICPDCAQVFASQKCLTHHRRSHNKALGCPECGKQFRDKYNLKCHMRTHTGESPYTCTDCGDVFAQLKGLQEHRNIHTEERPFRCNVCGEGFHHSHTLTKHKLLHSQESFLCTRCGKSFKLNDDLLRHLRTVHDEMAKSS
uniref:Uncharacterized protein n=1 Tax=Oncorhynchus tshawytscha TaxID=74940 RepID=A0A8C8EXQ7_ONCTS